MHSSYQTFFKLFTISIFTIVPFIYYKNLYDPVLTVQSFSWTILTIPILLLSYSKTTRRAISFGYIDVLLFIYFLFSSISIINSNDISISVFEICKTATFYTTFKILQFHLTASPAYAVFICIAISINSFIQCTLAIYQIQTGITTIDPYVRFLGTMTHSNVFSECILFSLPFIVIAIKQTRWPLKLLPFSALLLCCLLIIIAQTRAVWVGGTLGVLIVAIFLFKNKHIPNVIAVVETNWKLFSIVASIFTLISFFLLKNEWSHISSHIITLKNFDSSGRDYLWQKTMSIISDNFFFGVGPGNWRFHIPVLNHIAYQRVHNDYLWVFAESGIFAFAAFTAIFIYAIAIIIKGLKKTDEDRKIIPYALLFGIIAYCTDSFFAFPKERPYLLILLSLLFAFSTNFAQGKILFTVDKKIYSTVALVFAILGSWFCWNRMHGEIVNKRIIEYSNLEPSLKMNMLKSIHPFFYAADPLSTPMKSIEGSLWVELGNLQNAKQCYLAAYRMAPLNPDICNNIGSICEIMAERDNARTYYKKGILIDSSNFQTLLNLAVIEYKDGNSKEAANLVRKIDPDSIAGQENLFTQYEILKSSLRIK